MRRAGRGYNEHSFYCRRLSGWEGAPPISVVFQTFTITIKPSPHWPGFILHHKELSLVATMSSADIECIPKTLEFPVSSISNARIVPTVPDVCREPVLPAL